MIAKALQGMCFAWELKWLTKKQKTIALSSAGGEYISAADAACEVFG
jgi:hypothetical protein